jgi:hypothetical protein
MMLTKKGNGLQIWHTSFSKDLVHRRSRSAAANFYKDSEIACICCFRGVGSEIIKFPKQSGSTCTCTVEKPI